MENKRKTNKKISTISLSKVVRQKSTVDNLGITLISLVVTIVVLLILAGVSLNLVIGQNGVITKAIEAKEQTQKAQAQEEVDQAILLLQLKQNLEEMTQEERRVAIEKELKHYQSASTVTIDGDNFVAIHRGYEIKIKDDYRTSINKVFNAAEWDKTAAPADVFIWQSDDPNDEGYGIVIGYTENANNYTTLRYPSRCTKIEFSNNINYDGIDTETSRTYTNNILKVEIPDSVTSIGNNAFGNGFKQSFKKLEIVDMGNGVTTIGAGAFYMCTGLTSVTIPNSVTRIEMQAFFNYYCIGLTSVTIPNSVTSIGTDAFYNVPHIYYTGTATGSPWGALAIN